MADGSVENDNTNCELNDQNITDSTKAKDSDTFYEEIIKLTHNDFVMLKEMEEDCIKMRKEIALLQLDAAASFSPQIKKAESSLEANMIKAAETIEQIQRTMSSELKEISNLLTDNLGYDFNK